MQTFFGGVRRLAVALVRFCASRILTFVLAALVGAALAGGAYLERACGLEFAQWYVYDSRWFVGLLAALAVNVVAVAIVRFERRWNQAGPAVASAGLAVLLAGSIGTLVRGIEGRLVLAPGETAHTVIRPHRSQIVVLARHGNDVQSTELGFSPGPGDRYGDEPLDFGEVDGVRVKVLRFVRHARFQTEWVADETGLGKGAIQVSVPDAQTGSSVQRWCVPVLLDSPPVQGQLEVSLEQVSVESLRDEFLKPPALKPGSRGILSAHYKDRAFPIPVDGNTGKRVPLGDTGLAVEIVEYYANARSDKEKSISEGALPKYPMLQLRVHVPERKQPISEVAHANHPFLSFGMIHKKQDCPVKFWYHHPDAVPSSGAEFLQTPDGKLYCRVGDGRAYQSRGEVKEGDRIAIAADREISLLRHLRHARQEGVFVPVELAGGETSEAEAAALLEVTTAENSQQFWLGRDDPRLGMREIKTPAGPRLVLFGYAISPLGFSVKLADFQKIVDPDSPSDVSWVSQVQLIEPTQDPEAVPLRQIAEGRPLPYRDFTFYQSGVRELPGWMFLSVLRVTSDPGWPLKWSGAAVFCLGVLWMLGTRIFAQRVIPAASSPS